MNTTIAKYAIGTVALIAIVLGIVVLTASDDLRNYIGHRDAPGEEIATDIITRIEKFAKNEGDLPSSISYDIIGDMEPSPYGKYKYEFGSAETEVVESGTARFNDYRIPAAIIRAKITWIDRGEGNKKVTCNLLTEGMDKEFEMYRLVRIMNCDGSSANVSDATGSHTNLSEWKSDYDFKSDYQGVPLDKPASSQTAALAPSAPTVPTPTKGSKWSQISDYCLQKEGVHQPCDIACIWRASHASYQCLVQYYKPGIDPDADAKIARWRQLSAEYGALAGNAKQTTAVGLPTEVGECRETKIGLISPRFEADPSGGNSVIMTNGGYGVSYDEVPEIKQSRVGDPVQMCLASVPQNCPPGDDRGREYTITNERTGQSWTLPDSQHGCGGA